MATASEEKVVEKNLLEAEPRTAGNKNEARRVRRGGKIPAVLYGAGKDALTRAEAEIAWTRTVSFFVTSLHFSGIDTVAPGMRSSAETLFRRYVDKAWRITAPAAER